jgi:flagella basal body P-ring formation protein FlgA
MMHEINTLNVTLNMMELFKKFALFMLSLSLAASVHAQALAPRQDAGAMRKSIEQFLRIQSAGLPGEISIVVGPIDPHLFLASCPGPEVFLPNGNRAWGKTTVGVRCTEPARWTVYISATVHVVSDYIAAVTALVQGQVIGQHDVASVHGDLTTLPPGVITDLSQAIGFTASRSLQPGVPLRQDSLRSKQAIQQGQIVRLVSSGEGFRVSAEGRALSSASEGQVIQAKTAGGQIVSGIAKMGGALEVNY